MKTTYDKYQSDDMIALGIELSALSFPADFDSSDPISVADMLEDLTWYEGDPCEENNYNWKFSIRNDDIRFHPVCGTENKWDTFLVKINNTFELNKPNRV